jgi:hypothetical protein
MAGDVVNIALALALLVILAAGVRAIIRAAEADKRRARRLADLAGELDWSFSGQPMAVDVQSFKPFTWFIRGPELYILNTYEGRLATRHGQVGVRMGDFRAVARLRSARGREAEQYTEFSYLLADLPFDTGGRLLVRPQGLLDAVASTFVSEDIDFESVEFNRRFLVRASSRRFAYDVLHPGTIDVLMSTEPMPILIDGRRCCITDATSRWTAALFRSKLNWFGKFIDAFPTHLTGPAA